MVTFTWAGPSGLFEFLSLDNINIERVWNKSETTTCGVKRPNILWKYFSEHVDIHVDMYKSCVLNLNCALSLSLTVIYSSYLWKGSCVEVFQFWGEKVIYIIGVALKRWRDNRDKHECPPAWTQEAYRPPRSCSVSWLPDKGGGDYPIQSWWGDYPIQSWLGGGAPVQSWQEQDTPVYHLVGQVGLSSPIGQMGVPSVSCIGKSPCQLEGIPSPSSWWWYPLPLAWWGTSPVKWMSYPTLARWGTPLVGQMRYPISRMGVPPPEMWTDTCENSTFPRICTRAVTVIVRDRHICLLATKVQILEWTIGILTLFSAKH